VQPIASRLHQLSSTLTGAALAFLPGYDQRLCDQNIKQLEAGVDLLRQKVPKARFAFKKKQSSTVTPSVPVPAPSSFNVILSTPETSSFRVSDKKGAYINLNDFRTSMSPPPSSKLDSEPRDVILASLESCIIDLLPREGTSITITALYGRGLRRCVIMCGLVQGSVRLEDCTDCQIVIGCHQFRMEQCSSTDVYLNVSSLPVIEQSNSLRFTGYPEALALVSSGLSSQPSQHNDVKDFSWIKSTASPNWIVLEDGNFIDWAMELDHARKEVSPKLVVDMAARLIRRLDS